MWWADVQRYLSNKYTAESAGEKKKEKWSANGEVTGNSIA